MNSPEAQFVLDAQLAADSLPLAELSLSKLRLMNDVRFPWLLLVPRRPDLAELIDLKDDERRILFDEISMVSAALRAATACDKLNVAALGNVVRQLHVHVIARFVTDAAWPKPVWGSGPAVAYGPVERDRLVERILAALPA